MSTIPPPATAGAAVAEQQQGAVVRGGNVDSMRMMGLYPSNPNLLPISPAPKQAPKATALGATAYAHILPNVSPYETNAAGLHNMMGPKRKITHEVSEDGSNPSEESDDVSNNKNKKLRRSSSSDLYIVQASDAPIESFTEQDVLSGRGGGTNAHPGNCYFRDLIQEHRRQYLKARKNDKPTISRTIVRKVREAGGRFLKKHKTCWVEIGDYAAREKTSQALRQRAPEMRQMMFQTEANEATALGGPGASAGAASNTLAPPHPMMATHEPAPAPAAPPAAHCRHEQRHHQDHHSVHHHPIDLHHHRYEDPQHHQQEVYAHQHGSPPAHAPERHHHPHGSYVPSASSPATTTTTTAASTTHSNMEDRYHHHQHRHVVPPATAAPSHVDETTKDDPVYSASLLHALGTSHHHNSSNATTHHRSRGAEYHQHDDGHQYHHHHRQQHQPETSHSPAYHQV